MNGTVQQFLDTLEEMRTLYPFENEETYLSTHDVMSLGNSALEIATTDKKAGVHIVMSKKVNRKVR